MVWLFEHRHPVPADKLAAMHENRRQTFYWSRAGLDAIEGHHELAAFTLSARPAARRHIIHGMLHLFWFDQADAWDHVADDLGDEVARLHARQGPIDLVVVLGAGARALPYLFARLRLLAGTRLEYVWKQGRTS